MPTTSIPCMFYSTDLEDQYPFEFFGFIEKNDKLVWTLRPSTANISRENVDLTHGKNYYLYFNKKDMANIQKVLLEKKSVECKYPTRFLIQLYNDSIEQFIFPLIKISWFSNNTVVFKFKIESIFIEKRIVTEFLNTHKESPQQRNETPRLQDQILNDAIDVFIKQETLMYHYAKEKHEEFTSKYLHIENGQMTCDREAILHYLMRNEEYEEGEYCMQKPPIMYEDKVFIFQFLIADISQMLTALSELS